MYEGDKHEVSYSGKISRYAATFVPSIHAYIHTYIHTYIHAYIHTHIHTDQFTEPQAVYGRGLWQNVPTTTVFSSPAGQGNRMSISKAPSWILKEGNMLRKTDITIHRGFQIQREKFVARRKLRDRRV